MEWRQVLFVEGKENDDRVLGIRRSEPKAEMFTDFEGKGVPLDLLQRMRMIEGISEEDWCQRGVEVGDETWKLLTDWQEGTTECEYFSILPGNGDS